FISLNDTFELLCDVPTEHGYEWYFYRPSSSTTFYVLTFQKPRTYILSMDNLASVEDYKLFPYLADSLAHFLEGSIEETSRENTIYQLLNEEWMEGAIADEIARLKGSLTIFPKYYIHQSLQGAAYVSVDTLSRFGVTLTSATPRIYGYIQYMMQHNLLPVSTEEEIKQESQSSMLTTHEE
ncbi:MAG: sel1 repeat family protein, partial [Bacteroides sp.]